MGVCSNSYTCTPTACFTGWSCVHSDGSAILLEGPGQLASPFYPQKSNNVICKWIISPPTPNAPVQVRIKDIGFGRLSDMLKFESKTLRHTCTAKTPCDAEMKFKGEVVVQFQADVMPIKGFHLEYSFPSPSKPSPRKRQR